MKIDTALLIGIGITGAVVFFLISKLAKADQGEPRLAVDAYGNMRDEKGRLWT